MNKFLIIAIIAVVAAKLTERQKFMEFQKFEKNFGKKYTTMQEYLARFRVFSKNLERLGKRSKMWMEGVTKFFDLTPNEFKRTYCNLDISVTNTIHFNRVEAPIVNDPPEAYDWRDKQAVSAIKDQKSCGSCWAFSSTGNLEGLYYLKYKNMITFSEQQLVDCDTKDSGCNGGLMEYTFAWIQENGGLMSDADYKYKGYKGRCQQDESKYKVKVTGYDLLTTTDEDEILNYVYTVGPMAVALNADNLSWYTGGIIDEDEDECDPDGLNHAVLMIGWGEEDGLKYWIIKNSWGKSWGEDGYFRIARGKGTCGINNHVVSATL